MENISKEQRKAKLLQELQDLESQEIEKIEEPPASNEKIISENDAVEAVKVKKPRTPKQLEAFNKALAIRDANTLARKAEQEKKKEEERKALEEKLVKKAIAVKKKQIKKQQMLDEISDEDTPLQQEKKPNPIANLAKPLPEKPTGPVIRFY